MQRHRRRQHPAIPTIRFRISGRDACIMVTADLAIGALIVRCRAGYAGLGRVWLLCQHLRPVSVECRGEMRACASSLSPSPSSVRVRA